MNVNEDFERAYEKLVINVKKSGYETGKIKN